MKRTTLLATALVVVLALARPAGAADASVAVDPRGDAVGPGDVVGVRFEPVGTGLRLQVRTRRPINAAVAPTWTNPGSQTRVRFTLDVHAGPGADYAVILKPTPMGPTVLVQGRGESTVGTPCAPTFGQPDPSILRVFLPYSCTNPTTYVRGWARHQFDQGGDGDVESVDRAPDAGFTPLLFIP